jgi:nitrogen regulatory protein PII-like uncharacterized protein
MTTIKVFVNTGFAGCTHTEYEEFDTDEWEALSEEEQETYLDSIAIDYMNNVIEAGAYVVDEDD